VKTTDFFFNEWHACYVCIMNLFCACVFSDMAVKVNFWITSLFWIAKLCISIIDEKRACTDFFVVAKRYFSCSFVLFRKDKSLKTSTSSEIA